MAKSHFDQNFLAACKKALLSEKERLTRELKGTKFQDFGTSEDDNAQEVEAYEQNLSLKRNLDVLLSDINTALSKIEKGTYGKCEKGPERIEKERLEAFPAATLCMKHQKEADKISGKVWWQPWTWRK
jgi:RNA polymerase-binding transcription factor DksA